MTFYKKNMECIKKNRVFMYNSIKDIDISSTSNRLDEIYSVNTKDGEKAVIINFQSVQYKLNSTYYPVEEAKKWVIQYKFKNLNNIISMFGFGNGIFARSIIDRMGENDILLIYEPCADIFFHALNEYDLSDILSNHKVSISIEKINEFEFHNDLRGVMDITNMSDQIMCVYPQYDKIFTESCINFWTELKESYFSTRTNINTEIIFGKRFIENALNNIKFIRNSNTLHELKEYISKDVAAIVVAAGPSVEKQIEELKRAKGKSVIIAVDRIFDYLLDSGLEPDFVVTLDPMKPVKYFSKRTDIKIPLICFLEANKEILELHNGKKVICNCTEFLNKVYIDAGKIPPRTNSSASVATLAFTVCAELGFKNIILVGQDLAYDGELSHSGGVEEVYGTDRDVMIEDINGNQIRSRYDWKQFVIWYQDILTIYPQLNVIDAKEKGAKIKGTTVMPLKKAINSFCKTEFDCNKIFEKIRPTFNSDELINIKKYLEDYLDILETIKKKAKVAMNDCNKLIKECKRSNAESYTSQNAIKRLKKTNNYIAKQAIYAIMDPFIIATSAQYLLDIYHFTDDIKEDSLKTYEKSKYVFEAIIEAVDYIKPRLENAILDLE